MKNHKRKKYLGRKYIFPKLLRKLRFSILIIILLFCLSFYKLYNNDIAIFYFIFALINGILIGWFLWRMYNIEWDHLEQKVKSRIDAIWFIFLVAYITIELWKDWIFSSIVPDAQISAFWITLLTGLFTGRFIYMIVQIKATLKKKK